MLSSSEPKRFHEIVATLISSSPLTQREIAKKLGYEKSNIITMFKQGHSPVPINKVPALARALDIDPAWLMRLALREYHPEILETISSTMGFVVTLHEIEIIKELRAATGDSDPRLSDPRVSDPGQRAKLEEFARALVTVRPW